VIFMPAPTAVSTTRPKSSPKVLRIRSSTLPRPTCAPDCGGVLGVSVSRADPCRCRVLDDDHALGPAFSAVIVIVPPLACWPDRGAPAFSTSGCQRENGSTPRAIGAICSLMFSRPGPGLLQPD